MSYAITGMLSRMERAAVDQRRDLEQRLAAANYAGREKLTPTERRDWDALKDLERRIAFQRDELARCGSLPLGGNASRALSSAGVLSPLGFTEERMREAHAKVMRGETAILESRDFVTTGQLPGQLFPVPTFPRHEGRLLDYLPGFAMEAPSLEFVQVNSVTGTAGIVAEGGLKPELTMPATKLVITAKKLAAHAGISWESVQDFDAFAQAVRTELLNRIVDLETASLIYGNPTTGGLNGLTTTAGIIVHTATGGAATPVNHWDDIAAAIAKLRTGPALAAPDLICIHPSTWASIRTEKDTLGRYVSGGDPTDVQAATAWGLTVVQSTAVAEAEAILLDTTLFGRVAVREPINLKIGFSGDDFVRNIVRNVAEERLNLAVERPAAVCWIKALPASEVAGTEDGGEYTIAELKAELDERGVEYPNSARKADLTRLLEQSDG